MKKGIAVFVATFFLFAFGTAYAESWADFSASVSNGSALQGAGNASNFGEFIANGGMKDYHGNFSTYSSSGNISGALVSKGIGDEHCCDFGQGSVYGGIGSGVSLGQNPNMAYSSTNSNASTTSSSSGNVYSSGFAGVNNEAYVITHR